MFYTNVALIGNKIHMRYIENGVRKQNDFAFTPELFVKSSRGDYKDLYGTRYKATEMSSVSEFREQVKAKSGVVNETVCGNAKSEFEFIHKNFPQNIADS